MGSDYLHSGAMASRIVLVALLAIGLALTQGTDTPPPPDAPPATDEDTTPTDPPLTQPEEDPNIPADLKKVGPPTDPGADVDTATQPAPVTPPFFPWFPLLLLPWLWPFMIHPIFIIMTIPMWSHFFGTMYNGEVPVGMSPDDLVAYQGYFQGEQYNKDDLHKFLMERMYNYTNTAVPTEETLTATEETTTPETTTETPATTQETGAGALAQTDMKSVLYPKL